MKIENIEKACNLKNDLEAVNEILEAEQDKDGKPSSFVLMLYHNNERYNLNSLLTQETRTKIMNIIFDDCEARAEQIKQEIEKL